ncbi:type IV secretory system conjugative DNA transfer family protein [Desulfovibrio desulfuricans]|uniref:type IV secretory system conjugative DNA transfer family protein n=1 Tax=Desulfovibrio desulfuricans TaxID=876 RepID=UPI001AAAA4C1|nr:type IV secretory system conjugative DNA transfer family protein [Desulfovibrio desulfuricans]QTO41274.1 type IV secretory system conjugative DNA transfer family protein [Desulfovibrio desulfuricans]CAI3228599.1 Coupling protein VirD4, ATPase required for T-DNA transfer [Desulfovibrio diazotrophicus]VVU43201.1 Coupling protein VirD4, ATPase required for T-DNA transfer [Desulfovibrio diazotrophicus]
MAAKKIPKYGLGIDTPKSRLRWLYLPFMLLLGLGSMVLATQRIAAFFDYQAALGQPWGFAFDLPWYAPWSAFVWQERFGASDTYGFIDQAIAHSQVLFLLPQFLIIGFWLCFQKKLRSNANLHGSARWAEEREIRTMGYFEGKGVYVGGWLKKYAGFSSMLRAFRGKPEEVQQYLRHNGPEHIMVFAPTRSGKGVGLILPTLLAWEGSSIVLDIKGENWALTAGWRKSQDQLVLRFDPSDPSGASARFNPLEEIRLDTLLAIPDVQNMASMLVDPTGKGLEDHWSKAAFAMLGGAILHCCIMTRHAQKRTATLYDLSCMLADESRTIKQLFEEMVKTDHVALLKELFPKGEGGDKAHIFIASSAREMLNKAENEASGVVSTALTNLALYRDPVVALNTASCDFRIHDLMNHEKPVNLYLVISPADIDRMRPLLRLMVDMIVRRICAKMEFADGSSKAGYKHRLLLLLDEFTSLGKLPIMEKALAYIAGYGGKVYIIVQDITQLNAVYGKDNALMANCHVRIAYAPNTIETAKTLSDMTGKTTVVEEKVSLSGSRTGHMKNASVNVTETARPLLTPDECMRLPGPGKNSQGKVIKPGDMLIFTAGQSPIYGRQILYFFDPVFSARAKIPVPGLTPQFQSGITDSIYEPRPAAWYSATPAPAATPTPEKKEVSSEQYFVA